MSLRAAFSFFSTLPVPCSKKNGNQDAQVQAMSLEGIMAHAATVGAVLGLLVGGALCFATVFFSAPVAAVLAALVWVALTGALHVDGLADCADALLVEAPREKRLKIMKDPTVGSFACVAVFFVLALKVVALWHVAEYWLAPFLLQQTVENILFAALVGMLLLAFILALARAMVFLARRASNARAHEAYVGLGQSVTAGITRRAEWGTALGLLGLSFLLCFMGSDIFSTLFHMPWYGFGLSLLAALALALCVTRAIVKLAQRRIGGVTGDVYGCLIEVVECVVLLFFCVF